MSTALRFAPLSRRRSAVLAAAVLLAAGGVLATAGPAAAEPAPPPSFVGEQLNAVTDRGTHAFQVSCNPDGSGTASYTVTGQAFGPYPGTFTESGSLSFGPLEGSNSPVTAFDASFRVASDVGVVHGDKTLIPNSQVARPTGVCASPIEGADVPENLLFMSAEFAWDVTITTADAVYVQSGTGLVNALHLERQGDSAVQERFTDSPTGEPAFVALLTPTSVEQCKQNGFAQYGIFKNQGDCVAFVETLGRNEPGRNEPGQHEPGQDEPGQDEPGQDEPA